MRIIAKGTFLNYLIVDIQSKKKTPREIASILSSLRDRYPRNHFFKSLEREFGAKDVNQLVEVLKDNERLLFHFRALEPFYKEIELRDVGNKITASTSLKKIIKYKGDEVGYAKISKTDYGYNIDDIYVWKSGKGVGTSFIKKEMLKAVKGNYILTLTSDAMRGKVSQKKNRALYTKLGFIRNNKENKIKSISEEFYYPKQ